MFSWGAGGGTGSQRGRPMGGEWEGALVASVDGRWEGSGRGHW